MFLEIFPRKTDELKKIENIWETTRKNVFGMSEISLVMFKTDMNFKISNLRSNFKNYLSRLM